MHRRAFLASVFAAPLAARNRIDASRFSAITDEIAPTPGEGLAFARKFGLRWLELRNVPGTQKSYFTLDESEVRAAAREFQEAGVRISFLNTSLLKFLMPGTEPARKRQETPEAREKRLAREQAAFDRRLDDLRSAIRAAHILGTDLVRMFAFSRVEEPEKLYPRVAEIIGEMVRIAEREGVRLALENEASTNAGTSAEAAAFVKLIPSRALGINWDSLNSKSLKENPFPEGYRAVPRKRLFNVQIKGRSVLEGADHLDWATIFRTLDRDGYRGQIGLETHMGNTSIANSHVVMREMLRIVTPT